VDEISVGRAEDGRAARIRITYRFARPVQEASGITNHKTFEILSGDTPIPEAIARL
jgi:hypothetical protein